MEFNMCPDLFFSVRKRNGLILSGNKYLKRTRSYDKSHFDWINNSNIFLKRFNRNDCERKERHFGRVFIESAGFQRNPTEHARHAATYPKPLLSKL